MVDLNRNVYCILGLPFDAISMTNSLLHLRNSAKNNCRCFLSTPNLNFLIASQTDKAFRDSVIDSDLSIADGMPIIWIAKILRIPIVERVAGSDLFEKLRESCHKPLKVFFFGGMDGIAETACNNINKEKGGLLAVGFETPGFGEIDGMSSQLTINKINACNPDFVVVALGAKKGQAWIQQNRDKINAPIISHLGAVVNFVAGNIKRAPHFFQKLGFEWLWRIYQEPTLWKRYYSDSINLCWLLFAKVFPYKLWIIKNRRYFTQKQDLQLVYSQNLEYITIQIKGACTIDTLTPLKLKLSELVEEHCFFELDLKEVVVIDSAFVGLCILLYGHLSKLGGNLKLVNINNDCLKIIKWNCAEFIIDN